jgi:hypothetical protein
MKNTEFVVDTTAFTNMSLDTETMLDNYFNIRYGLFNNKITELSLRSENIKMFDDNYLLKYQEYRKLNMNYGRQTGHSFYIHWMLNHCTKNNQKCLVIFLNFKMKQYFVEQHISNIDNHILVEFNNIEELRGVSLDYVIVDTSDIYKTHQIKSLIKTYHYNNPKLFLYL